MAERVIRIDETAVRFRLGPHEWCGVAEARVRPVVSVVEPFSLGPPNLKGIEICNFCDMTNEYLDIVDEDNKPTGEKRLRSEVHALGLWHRTVHAYFYREMGNSVQFLVHLRAKTKDLHPNAWDTRFGGHLKSGESLEDAVKHEVHEETGLELGPSELLSGKTYKRDHSLNREFTHVYYYHYQKETNTLHFNDGEVQTAEWMSIDDIRNSIQKGPKKWSAGLKGFEEVVSFLASTIAGAR